jgi:hypothetical protein
MGWRSLKLESYFTGKSGITKHLKNDEWMTNKQTVSLMYSLLEPKPASTILCPFDTENSNFVKHGLNNNYSMVYGIRDYLDNDYEHDYLITNPPFSLKDKIIEKIFKSGKPSALVLPIDALGGKRRHELYKQYNYPTIYLPTRRINYVSPDGQQTKANHFHSIILIFNDPKGSRLIWE